MIDQQAAAKVCKDIKRRLMDMPMEELRAAHRQMAIEAHNRAIDEAKARKKAEKIC